MIKRQLFYILIGAVGILSCKPTSTPSYTLEIIKLGLADHFDTNEFSKVGGPVYVRYQQGADSMLLKSNMTEELVREGLFDADKQRVTYTHQHVNDSLEQDFQYVIDYLKPMRDGRLPDNYRNADMIVCNLLGTWLVVLTYPNQERHYYNYAVHNLPAPLRRMTATIYETALRNISKRSIDTSPINTDSIVAAILKLPCMDSIELAPKVKTRLRFTPPEIEAN